MRLSRSFKMSLVAKLEFERAHVSEIVLPAFDLLRILHLPSTLLRIWPNSYMCRMRETSRPRYKLIRQSRRNRAAPLCF